MTTFKWHIAEMNRHTADGFVFTVHYVVYAQDGDIEDSTYGSIAFTKEPDTTYVPYADLTEAQVIGWVQESLGKDTVEASLQSKIDQKKAPVEATGKPWNTTAPI